MICQCCSKEIETCDLCGGELSKEGFICADEGKNHYCDEECAIKATLECAKHAEAECSVCRVALMPKCDYCGEDIGLDFTCYKEKHLHDSCAHLYVLETRNLIHCSSDKMQSM